MSYSQPQWVFLRVFGVFFVRFEIFVTLVRQEAA